MSANENKTFTFINNEKLCGIIKSAQNHIIYAAPSVSEAVAESLCKFKENNPTAALRVIIDANAEVFRLGFGEQAGLVLLSAKQIDIRRAKGLRIAVLAADENAWVYSPTPEIIFEQPTARINNAIQVSVEFAKQILLSVAPDVSLVQEKDVLDESFISEDVTPEIGTEIFTDEDLKEIKIELNNNPPKKFDAEREVRVYQGYIQFVELSLNGCRLKGKTITLPKDLLNIADIDLRGRVKTTCRMLLGGGAFSARAALIEERVINLRKGYLKSLGKRYGSVILRRERGKFDEEIDSIKRELEKLRKSTAEDLKSEIANSRENLIKMLLPGVMGNPPLRLPNPLFGETEEQAREYIGDEIDKQMPVPKQLLSQMRIVCDYKDVTFEMLNDEEFIRLIEEKFPEERFGKLYSEEQTIAEREKYSQTTENKSDGLMMDSFW